MLDDLDLASITDEGTRELVVRLLNLIETLSADLRAAQAEIQRLRDENNRLKGEQGKPNIKPGTKPTATDHSSESERRQNRPREKGRKVEQVQIDREQVLQVDPAVLPPDAQFKGYEKVVVQDLVVHTDNVLFRKEKFYSPSRRKTYLAELPPGYRGEFGPGIRALVIIFAFACQMTEPKILEWFRQVGVQISAGQISNLLIKDQQQFHGEKDAVYQAGLASSPWQHLDDTATRVNGQNQHCHVVNNPLHTTYLTTRSKDRLSVIDVLRNGLPRRFRLGSEALRYLETAGVSGITRQQLSRLPQDWDLDEATMHRLLEEYLPNLGTQTRKWILAAAAVAAYHAQREWPVVRLLVCDDAPQFTSVTEELALCWVHEGRHYKKLFPYVAQHQQLLEDFLGHFWDFYRELLAYRQQPTPGEQQRLEQRFDALFATKTSYWALDQRIGLTRAKKTSLLMVLAHPEIPLHNNSAELDARQRVRKRKISFGPRVADGTKAWDTFMSLAGTTRKLGVNFYHYIQDRISGANQIPQLASIIEERAKELNLGASWATA
ncbi:MAG: transposase [Chloroflexi bacterium]|nr:transposase [Chloroflexota bacterium]